MKLKLLAPLLLSLVASPAFAHGDHDDDGPVVTPKQVVRKDAPAPKTTAGKKPAAKDVKLAADAAATPATQKP